MKIGIAFLQKTIKQFDGIKNIPLEIISRIPSKTLMQLDDKQTNEFLDCAMLYWESKGFPYFSFTDKEIKKEYKKVLNYDELSLFNPDKKEISQNATGMAMASSFHDHRWSVKCRKFRTAAANFEDKKVFRKVLLKIIHMNAGNPFNDSILRSWLAIFSGTNVASNFRPNVAKFFFNKFCPMGGKVLDPCMGFSGRLLGALTSNISHYEACDPSTKTFNGTEKLLNKIKKIANNEKKLILLIEGKNENRLPSVKLHNIPFEQYDNKPNTFDLVFTSPPYFDTEKYADEPTQSYLKFPEYQQWVDGFIKPFVSISHKVLKPNGYFIINIAKTADAREIEKDFLEQAELVFGKIHDTYGLKFNKMPGTRGKRKGTTDTMPDLMENDSGPSVRGYKTEPCYIFKKSS